MRIFGKKKTEPGTAQAPSERDTQAVQRAAHTEPVTEPEAQQGPLEDRREGGRRDSYAVEPDPVPVRDEAPVDDHRPSADALTPVRGKGMPKTKLWVGSDSLMKVTMDRKEGEPPVW